MGRIEKYIESAQRCQTEYKGVLATQIFVIENYENLQNDNLRKEKKEALSSFFNISRGSFMTQFTTMMTLAEFVRLK
ncbi:MAG: hypothetical protein LBT01_09650 [Spirochaetaceae bacterium]|jgi:hypothetical protein|nr:hypothetical protein [Spirochaetaceae bacterium]